MEVSLAVLADMANRDGAGKLNIIGVFHEVRPKELPCSLNATIAIELSAKSAEAGNTMAVNVIAMDPKDQQIFTVQAKGPIPPPSRPGSRIMTNLVLKLDGLQLEHPGDYGFSIQINGDEKKYLPLFVHQPIIDVETEGS